VGRLGKWLGITLGDALGEKSGLHSLGDELGSSLGAVYPPLLATDSGTSWEDAGASQLGVGDGTRLGGRAEVVKPGPALGPAGRSTGRKRAGEVLGAVLGLHGSRSWRGARDWQAGRDTRTGVLSRTNWEMSSVRHWVRTRGHWG
jgi:hypothetical protein